MDPVELFKIYQKTQVMNKILVTEREIHIIDGEYMIKCMNGSYKPLEMDGDFMRIQNCVNMRAKSNSNTFYCKCGICSSFLLSKVYDNYFGNKTVQTDEQILEDSLKEVVRCPVPSPSNKAENTFALQIIQFGKHQGKTFQDVFRNDMAYCLWCIETCAVDESKGKKPSSNMSLFVAYIKLNLLSNRV